MAERQKLKPLAEEPPRMRRASVIVRRQRAPTFAPRPDVPQVRALGGIIGEGATFARRLLRAHNDPLFAAAFGGKGIGPDPPAGEIVGGEFEDRQKAGEPGGESVGRIVVLVRPFERRNPQRSGLAPPQRAQDIARRGVEVGPQPARGGIAEPDRFEPEQRGRFLGLGTPPRDACRIAPALPQPQLFARRHAGRQIEDEDTRSGRERARRGDAAGDDLVVGVGREDQDPPRPLPHSGRNRRSGHEPEREIAAAACHTGSRSSARTSAQLGTFAST
jgi:hypothetical protein